MMDGDTEESKRTELLKKKQALKESFNAEYGLCSAHFLPCAIRSRAQTCRPLLRGRRSDVPAARIYVADRLSPRAVTQRRYDDKEKTSLMDDVKREMDSQAVRNKSIFAADDELSKQEYLGFTPGK